MSKLNPVPRNRISQPTNPRLPKHTTPSHTTRLQDSLGQGGRSGAHHGQWIRFREGHASQYFSYHMLEENFRRQRVHPVLLCYERSSPIMFGGAQQRGLGAGAAIVSSSTDQLNGVLEIPADMKLELHDDHTVGLNRERIAALRSIGHSHDRSCSAGNCSVM